MTTVSTWSLRVCAVAIRALYARATRLRKLQRAVRHAASLVPAMRARSRTTVSPSLRPSAATSAAASVAYPPVA